MSLYYSHRLIYGLYIGEHYIQRLHCTFIVEPLNMHMYMYMYLYLRYALHVLYMYM